MTFFVYLYIFLQSNLLEVPFYYYFLKGNNNKFFKILGLITVINSLTHPIVFFLIMNMKLYYIVNILIAESFAIISETILVQKIFKSKFLLAFTASFIANLVSWQLAPALTYILFK